ncbi:lysis protein [Vibrio vulnificus]|nr:lysis protein [Vibrio vulnificus]
MRVSMLTKLKFITLVLMIGAILSLSLVVSMKNAEILSANAKLEAKKIELTSALNEVSALDSQLKEQREKIATFNRLSTKYSEELANAKAEIQMLSDSLRSGPKRVYVKASCPPAVSNTDTAGGVGDAGAARLTEPAREDYLRLRMMMAENERQTKYLQDYIKTQCIR